MNKCLACKKEIADNKKYCSSSCSNRTRILTEEQRKVLSDKAKLVATKKYGEFIDVTVKCDRCNKNFFINKREKLKTPDKLYCSKSCANKRVQLLETKEKIKNTLLLNKSCNVYFINCKECNKLHTCKKKTQTLCSKKCGIIYIQRFSGSAGGLASAKAQSETRRSKNEIAFADLCIKHFKDVKCNDAIFNGWDADIIIHDLKIAVLWNGAWHYKKITAKHSVKQVENRDKIKIKEITKLGYYPYIIKDMGRFDLNKVNDEFNKLLTFIK